MKFDCSHIGICLNSCTTCGEREHDSWISAHSSCYLGEFPNSQDLISSMPSSAVVLLMKYRMSRLRDISLPLTSLSPSTRRTSRLHTFRARGHDNSPREHSKTVPCFFGRVTPLLYGLVRIVLWILSTSREAFSFFGPMIFISLMPFSSQFRSGTALAYTFIMTADMSTWEASSVAESRLPCAPSAVHVATFHTLLYHRCDVWWNWERMVVTCTVRHCGAPLRCNGKSVSSI